MNSRSAWSTGRWSRADFNGDGQTDGQAFIVWNANKFRTSDALHVDLTYSMSPDIFHGGAIAASGPRIAVGRIENIDKAAPVFNDLSLRPGTGLTPSRTAGVDHAWAEFWKAVRARSL